MTTVDDIYEQVRTLPAGHAKVVLVVLQATVKILRISSNLLKGLRQPDLTVSSTRAKRLALSHQAKGRFADLSNSSDVFAQRKQAEIDWEERK